MARTSQRAITAYPPDRVYVETAGLDRGSPNSTAAAAGPQGRYPASMPSDLDRGAPDWRRLLAVFWLTSMVEGLGVSQVFALLPAQLFSMGITGSDRLQFVGLFSSLLFVLGMPLVPLWGVWADRYSLQGGDRPERARRDGRLRRHGLRSRALAGRGSCCSSSDSSSAIPA